MMTTIPDRLAAIGVEVPERIQFLADNHLEDPSLCDLVSALEAMHAELRAYDAIIREVSVVYMEITGGRFSKPSTLAEEVLAEAYEIWQQDTEREIEAALAIQGAELDAAVSMARKANKKLRKAEDEERRRRRELEGDYSVQQTLRVRVAVAEAALAAERQSRQQNEEGQ
jgi:hypothetical protein